MNPHEHQDSHVHQSRNLSESFPYVFDGHSISDHQYHTSESTLINHSTTSGRVLFLAGSYSPPQTTYDWKHTSDDTQFENFQFRQPTGANVIITPDRKIPLCGSTTSRALHSALFTPDKKIKHELNEHQQHEAMRQQLQQYSDLSLFMFQLPSPNLDTMPEEIVFSILEFLSPDEILSRFGSLNRRCHEIACDHQLWEDRLQRLHPIIDLLDIQKGALAERRSKGKVQVALLKGTKRKFTVRSVSLETTNAGKDDGVPTSCLRELSLLSGVLHRNVIRCFGATVQDAELKIVTEYCGMSLMSILTSKKNSLSPEAIRNIIKQIITGVAELHQRGILHRNIKSDNIVVEEKKDLEVATVKICDLSMGRAVDFPLGMYTPEDPKERDRSYREQRRLYNRAPEIILRQSVYGLEVDLWSIGCVFLELALGTPPFRCESEIGLIMSSLQLCGTPDVLLWDRLSSQPETFLKLPQWDPIDFRAVAKVLSDPSLREQGVEAYPLKQFECQVDSVKMLLNFGYITGVAGLHLLERLIILPGCFRISTNQALMYPYFTSPDPNNHPLVMQWIQGWDTDRMRAWNDTKSTTAGRSMKHFTRFIDEIREQQSLTSCTSQSPSSSAYWNTIKVMEEKSVRLPSRYDLVAAIPFDYSEEREKLELLDLNKNSALRGTTHERNIPDSSQTGSLPPVPWRSRQMREQQQPDPSISTSGETRGHQSRIEDEDEIISIDNQLEYNGNQLEYNGNQLEYNGNQLEYNGNQLEYNGNQLEYNGNGSDEWMKPEDELMEGNSNINQDLSGSTEVLIEMGSEVEQPDTLERISVNLNEEMLNDQSHLKEDKVLSEESRGVIALSQSPVNELKLKGQDTLRPPRSWKQMYSMWGKHWERLGDTCPPVKRYAALSYMSRNMRLRMTSNLISDYSYPLTTQSYPPSSPSSVCLCYWPRVSPRSRTDIVNYLLGVQPDFCLKSQTLHSAIGLFDRYSSFLIGYPNEFSASDFVPVALACLKLADLCNEVSKEYYKQDNITEYAEFASSPPKQFEDLVDAKGHRLCEAKIEPKQLLDEEKKILNTLRFDILVPTVCWFIDAYLSIAKLLHMTYIVDYCHYLADLSLHSHQLLAYRPALQAQVILLIACSTLLRPKKSATQSIATNPSGGGTNIIRPFEPEFLKPLEKLLSHFIIHRNVLCSSNCVWEVLDCISIFRDLLLNGRRFFDAAGLRNVERLHPWVGRLAIPTPMTSPCLVKCILPSSQDSILDAL